MQAYITQGLLADPLACCCNLDFVTVREVVRVSNLHFTVPAKTAANPDVVTSLP